MDVLRGRPNLEQVGQLVQAIFADDGFRMWGLDIDTLRRELGTLPASYADVSTWLVRRYGATVGKSSADIWIDHTPLHVKFAATLSGIFPTAKFIHIVRDGRGVAASVLPLDWGPNTVERAARWWTELLAFGLALESWGGTRVIRVLYEDLILEPETTVRRISAFVGIDYRPAMLKADGFVLPPDPGRQHALIGSPPQPDRARAWSKTLSPREIEIFESVAADLLTYLGYELQFGMGARPPSTAEHLISAFWDRYRERLVNRIRWRRRRTKRLRLIEARRRGRLLARPVVGD